MKTFLFHHCTDFLLQRNRRYQSSYELKLYKDISVSPLHRFLVAQKKKTSEFLLSKTLYRHFCFTIALLSCCREIDDIRFTMKQNFIKTFLFHYCTTFLLQRNRRYQSSYEVKLYKDISVSPLH